jgi:tetratricopeptide (TPR) repeat protein/transglutaminase-like putative cysteine protease
MPLGYVPIRKIWSDWDTGDPSEVEAALSAVSSDATVAPPLRSYARLLEAYGRRRRGDLEGAKAIVRSLGFVDRWIVAGPFDNEGKQGLDRVFGPEDEILEPLTLARTYDGKERAVPNRLTPEGVFPYGWVDLGALLRPQENVCAYATTFVRHARATSAKPERFSVWVGASGALRVFFDSKAVLSDAAYRKLDTDRQSVTLTMREGWHRLTVKVCGADDAPMFSLRLAGETGAPDANLEADANPMHAKEAASVRYRKGEHAVAPPVVGGALPAFERLAVREDPAALEAYARWLVLTRAADPAQNVARDVARRAAEKAPTIARCLLAAELAESRNQAAMWLDRAEALLQRAGRRATDSERLEVLLARALHLRSGPNWRDAIPVYERARALDPDNITANLAEVELYAEAGLRQTSLTFLERALAMRPKSVALLRAMASALRELDRTAESEDIYARYEALRFDDRARLEEQLERALARRDTETAVRGIERLLDTSPDSSRALATAAKAYISLGDRARAIALYKRLLELAPEDIVSIRALAEVHAISGQTDEQLRLLKRALELRPQLKEVRDYLAHAEPGKPRADEAYAQKPAVFLARRNEPAEGRTRRTLVSLQVTTVFPNGLASRFHQVVFQPLTDAAAAEAREYGFGFQGDTETVQLRGARIYRKSGQIDEAIESGEVATDDPQMAMYSSARAFYVHFPRLDPGDVVELLYRVEDTAPRNAFADYFGEVVPMQSTEPTWRSEYVLITPKSRSFYFNRPKVPNLTRTNEEQGEQRVYRFVAENVTPLESEPGMPPLSETLGHVHVSTFKNWEEMGAWYWGLVKDQLTPDDEVRRRALEITKGLTDDRAKVRAVYGYVVQKTRYVALEFGIHGFKPYRCAQIFARGFGDCKDKATLIVAMLKELGIDATLVIVRTGQKGDFETEPASLAPFDHAIAYVPSLDWYLDGTAEFTGSTELPSMDRGALAILVNEGKPKLVRLPQPDASESVSKKTLEAVVHADGSAELEWTLRVTGARASSFRQRFHAKATQRARLSEELASEWPGLEVASVTTGDLDDIERPVELRARGKAPSFARRDGASFTVFVGARERMVRAYATLSSRSMDLRTGPLMTDETETSLVLPQGAKVTDLPRTAQQSTPFGDYRIEAEVAGSTVRIKTSVTLKKQRIFAREYGAFRAFCEEIDRDLSQSITFTVSK